MAFRKDKILAHWQEPKKRYQGEIGQWLQEHDPIIVVLDDDPTGCQTVHGIPVFTDWSPDTIQDAFKTGGHLFFILTNSRSMKPERAKAVAQTIGAHLQQISQEQGRRVIVISRSDSTLRGHYPNEVDALAKGLGYAQTKHVLIPAFFEGGRYTYGDVHYVEEGEHWIPAADTPFAKDSSFGYTSSNLRQWIVEKSSGTIKDNAIASFPVDLSKKGGPDFVSRLLEHPKYSHYVANAVSYPELEVVALGSLCSKAQIIFRTAASFINVIANVPKAPLLQSQDLVSSGQGGLVVVGSYVPKTTEQLQRLMEGGPYAFHRIDVEQVLEPKGRDTVVQKTVTLLEKALSQGSTAVLYTSREVIKGADKDQSLDIVNTVSSVLVDIVKGLGVSPKFILTKGGITSSDIATKALGVKRAKILGQILEGVPVWKLGPESKFPEIPYIVFPGNVGTQDALRTVLERMHSNQ